MPATLPKRCSECNSDDIRVVEVAEHLTGEHRARVQKAAGKYRWMCDQCGAAGAVFDDKPDAQTRQPQDRAIVDAIREKVGKAKLTGGHGAN